MTKLDPAMKKGATLTLTDRQAELLMQSRYAMDDDRNTQRMRRQQIFLNAFMKKIKKQNAGDVNATVKLYDRLRPYATTDIKMNDLTALVKGYAGIYRQRNYHNRRYIQNWRKAARWKKTLGVLYG